jgi:uncharacterized phage-like protein YoqJ
MVKSICFSGHRTEKILSLANTNTQKVTLMESVKSMLYVKITHYIDEGFSKFYVGMSDGIDLWAGEILLELKLTQYPDMQIIAVKPFQSHGNKFSMEDKLLYNQIIAVADEIVCLHQNSSKWAYLERNRYMVDHSTKLLAFISDYKSGTGHTIRYAQSLNKPIEIVDINTLLV